MSGTFAPKPCDCGSVNLIRHGKDRSGQQRWKCLRCERTSMHFDTGIPRGIRVDPGRLMNFLAAIGRGHSLRTASSLAEINRDTGTNILRRLGYVKPGRKYDGWNRQVAGRTPLFCGAANVMRHIEDSGCSPHVRLAVRIAEEISEENLDLYLGPIYEGIELAHRRGIVDEIELRKIAKESVKQHWKEIQSYGSRSLDAMRDETRFEPVYAD